MRCNDPLRVLTPEVRFVDCGDNFQTVVCSRCGTDIAEWWAAAMEAAHEQQFADLRLTTPCCGTAQAHLGALLIGQALCTLPPCRTELDLPLWHQ